MKRIIVPIIAVLCITLSTTAQATTKKDLNILGRALGFVEGGPTGTITAAIVHDPSNADSKAHADELMGLMSGGLTVGKITLQGSLVDITAGNGGSTPVAFVTRGIAGNEAGYFSAIASNGTIVVGELSCVEAGNCVINVVSSPSVKIYVSKAASASASVSFASAFRMMITEK